MRRKNMSRTDLITELVNKIEKTVLSMHINRNTWNKACGQWLVYGFESRLGFFKAIELESLVERHYKNKTSMVEDLIQLFNNLTNKVD
jgi:hypothetical protein